VFSRHTRASRPIYYSSTAHIRLKKSGTTSSRCPKAERTTRRQPLQYEEFAGCLAWWNDRNENERAWKIPAKDLLEYSPDGSLKAVNLDRKNPNAVTDFEHLPPEQLADDILRKEQRIAEIMRENRELLITHDS
jgi:hypothetical protein